MSLRQGGPVERVAGFDSQAEDSQAMMLGEMKGKAYDTQI